MLLISLLWIFINIILSILIIYGGHYIWNLIKDTYSTKKTKDLVNTQIQKYKKMMAEIQNDSSNVIPNSIFLNDNEKIDMNHRLMEFMDDIQLSL
jgi:hypothetical protein